MATDLGDILDLVYNIQAIQTNPDSTFWKSRIRYFSFIAFKSRIWNSRLNTFQYCRYVSGFLHFALQIRIKITPP